MKMILLEEARIELLDAVEYYNLHKEKLGYEFKTLVNESLQIIENIPLLYPIIEEPLRRVILRRFPYSIFYFIDEVEHLIVIVSISLQHRKPFYKI